MSPMRRTALAAASTVALLASASAVSFGSSSCSSHDIDDVVFEGGASTDALETLLDAKIVDSPPDAAEFTWPTNGDIVELSPPPTFCWRQGAIEARLELPNLLRIDRASERTAKRAPSWFDRWFGVNTAYADGNPLSGRGFLLVFSSAAQPEFLRVFTTLADYTPDAPHMAMLTSQKGTIQAIVTTAIFADNVVMKTGGPFKGIPVTFTMAAPAAHE